MEINKEENVGIVDSKEELLSSENALPISDRKIVPISIDIDKLNSEITEEPPERETWTGKLDFFFSALGYAVGLGAVWWVFIYRNQEILELETSLLNQIKGDFHIYVIRMEVRNLLEIKQWIHQI